MLASDFFCYTIFYMLQTRGLGFIVAPSSALRDTSVTTSANQTRLESGYRGPRPGAVECQLRVILHMTQCDERACGAYLRACVRVGEMSVWFAPERMRAQLLVDEDASFLLSAQSDSFILQCNPLSTEAARPGKVRSE